MAYSSGVYLFIDLLRIISLFRFPSHEPHCLLTHILNKKGGSTMPDNFDNRRMRPCPPCPPCRCDRDRRDDRREDRREDRRDDRRNDRRDHY